MVFCQACGHEIHESAKACTNCGMTINKGKLGCGREKIVAALFAFFLGGFGAHKFYLGQTGMGILYLIFFWTCIPALVSFFEFIFLLVMDNDEFNEKYNSKC